MTVVVIGAGIAGACCAHALVQDGHAVTIIDAGEPGGGCSYGNAGQINIGTTLPIALPGILRSVPRWLTDPLGPVAVRWRYLPRAFPWLLRWVRAARREAADHASLQLKALSAQSLSLYRHMLGNAGFSDLIRTEGHLHVWETPHVSAGDQLADDMVAAKGFKPLRLDAHAIREIEPMLAPVYRRGLLFPDNGHTVNPQRLVHRLVEDCVRQGATLVKDQVRDIAADGCMVVTGQQRIAATSVVIAAGAWSGRLIAPFGLRVPLETERGYHAMLTHPGIALRVPVSSRDHHFTVTPMEHGLRLAGTVEIGGLAAPPNYRRATILVYHARRMFPALRAEPVQTWMGFRPSTPDSLPIIDHLPGCPNIYAAFGHGHYGLSLSPMTGRLIADLIANRPTRIDARPFGIGRF
jgi:glycine/D-amino acid oxidase-like deaminating enzyme